MASLSEPSLELNPLEDLKADEKVWIEERKDIALQNGLREYKMTFEQAVILLKSPNQWRDGKLDPKGKGPLAITEAEKNSLDQDLGSMWKKLRAQPWPMWRVILLCGLGALVQGWDEAAVNGAQVYYRAAYGLDPLQDWIGLINGAPYLCCFVSCWLSWPLNRYLGRTKSIWLFAFLSMAFALAQGFAPNWRIMLGLRFCLGFGIGPKSATIPLYASEIAPPSIRGALVMMWQLFTALGIFLGYMSGVAFSTILPGQNVLLIGQSATDSSGQPLACASITDDLLSWSCSANWRLMIASPMVAPLILMFYILREPESPRLMISQAQEAQHNQKPFDLTPIFQDLQQLRGGSKIKAARDFLIMDVLLWKERKEYENSGYSSLTWFWAEIGALFGKQRNLNALWASTIVMFLQQFCGINVLIYYSTLVLFQTDLNSGATPQTFSTGIPIFMVTSMCVGLINFLFGLPAVFLIDKWGRRTLLLLTFPLLALFEAFVAIGAISVLDGRISQTGMILAGMYLFALAYSPGEGPVPFVYASESLPQKTRDIGMSVVTSINWVLNFTVAVSFPAMAAKNHMTMTGVFWWYTGWCFVGFWLVVLFIPETKGKDIQRLDLAFDKTFREFRHDNWVEFEETVRKAVTNLRKTLRKIFRRTNSFDSDQIDDNRTIVIDIKSANSDNNLELGNMRPPQVLRGRSTARHEIGANVHRHS